MKGLCEECKSVECEGILDFDACWMFTCQKCQIKIAKGLRKTIKDAQESLSKYPEWMKKQMRFE